RPCRSRATARRSSFKSRFFAEGFFSEKFFCPSPPRPPPEIQRSGAPAASDRLAPTRCATRPAARQHPLRDGENFGGRVDGGGARSSPLTDADGKISGFRFFMGEPRSWWCPDGQFEALAEGSA